MSKELDSTACNHIEVVQGVDYKGIPAFQILAKTTEQSQQVMALSITPDAALSMIDQLVKLFRKELTHQRPFAED